MKIEIKNVNKSFGRTQALKNITLTATQGEILCLLGPSGAGKTTLIRLITGGIEADGGEIIINGVKIPDMSIAKRIGFMPQSDALYSDISGYDNMLFFGRLFGIWGTELKEKIDATLSLVGLPADRRKLVWDYSGGMRKRLSLAIALLHDPDILILDEPTVGIDPVLRKAIWDEFEQLRQKGRTIIVSTHVMDEAQRCQRAALIYDGSLIACGEVGELIAGTRSNSLEELFFTAKETAGKV